MSRYLTLCFLAVVSLGASAAELIDPPKGASIAIVGGGQGERLLRHPAFEAELQRRFAGRDLIIRNLCDDGDTPGYRDHSGRNSPYAYPGADKLYPLSKAKDYWGSGHAGSGFSQSPDEWLKGLKADIILGWFGYAESFQGAAGVAAFKADLEGWLEHTAQQKYNGKAAPQVVLLAPLAFDERTAPKYADAKATNANLALYAKAIQEVATARHLVFVDLFAQSQEMYHASVAPLTRDGFVLRSEGQELLAAKLASIFVAGAPKVANAALARPIFDALNVRHYLDLQSDQGVLGRALKIVKGADLDVYESATAWPRAFFTDHLDTYDTPAEFIQKIRAGDGRPFAVAQRPDLTRSPALLSIPRGLVDRTVTAATDYALTENSTTFTIRAKSAGVIVLNEVFWPGDFRATVNGQKTPVLRLNHTFKGITVDGPGDYRITFRYVPKNWPRHLALAATGAVLLLLSLWIALRRPPVARLVRGGTVHLG